MTKTIQAVAGFVFLLVLVAYQAEGCGKRWAITRELGYHELIAPDGLTYQDGMLTVKGIQSGMPLPLKEIVMMVAFFSSMTLYFIAWGCDTVLEKRKQR